MVKQQLAGIIVKQIDQMPSWSTRTDSYITVVSRVSAHARLNVHRDFGPHGHLPIEMRYMGAYPGVGACPGHYSMYKLY